MIIYFGVNERVIREHFTQLFFHYNPRIPNSCARDPVNAIRARYEINPNGRYRAAKFTLERVTAPAHNEHAP